MKSSIQSSMSIVIILILASVAAVFGAEVTSSPSAHLHPLTQLERSQFLRQHNKVRALTNPPASNMQKLVWSWDLELLAIQRVLRCNYSAREPPSNKSLPFEGKLISNAWRKSMKKTDLQTPVSPEDIVSQWFGLGQYFSYNDSSCDVATEHHPWALCREYLPVVNARVYAIGCAAAFCDVKKFKGETTLFDNYNAICYYAPFLGKLKDHPYRSANVCSECPDTMKRCDSGLCTTEKSCELVTECPPEDMTTCLCDESFYAGRYPSVEAQKSSGAVRPMTMIVSPLQLTLSVVFAVSMNRIQSAPAVLY